MQIVIDALAPYGATLSLLGEIIRKDGKTTGVTVQYKGTRLQFISSIDKRLFMSGPVAASTVEKFVERFWFWSKAAQ